MSEHPVRIGILGNGNIGAALVDLIETQASTIATRTGVHLEIAAVAVKALDELRSTHLPAEIVTTDAASVAADPDIDIVVELIGGVDPARTFILAALGLVHVPSSLVEPTIALSIAAVAALHLRRIWELRGDIEEVEEVGSGPLGLDRAGWARLGVVFCFGLVHGLGFASALGIDQAFSWTLLSSLLVFNLGIESVQLGIILLAFPALALLRRYRPVWGVSATGTIAAAVCAFGLVWFFQRAAIF